MVRTVFITGTDTGVGKSIFTAILGLACNKEFKTAIYKPIQTGLHTDVEHLLELTGNSIPIYNSLTYSLPAAPTVAAQYENKIVDLEKVLTDLDNLKKNYELVIVEGIGGIAVPFATNDYLVSDLIKNCNIPTIVVARPNLGTINHTLLTLEHALNKGISILGFVISGYDEKTQDTAILTASSEIEKSSHLPCLSKIPAFQSVSFKNLEDFALSTVFQSTYKSLIKMVSSSDSSSAASSCSSNNPKSSAKV